MATNCTNPSQEITACPFCGNPYKKLGNHLPRCKQRDNRDYSAYLSKKTLDKRNSKGKSGFCPKCNRKFLRLDTHMKSNPYCKTMQDQTNGTQTGPGLEPDSDFQPEIQESGSDPILSNSTNLSFNLPTTKDEWIEADEHFMEHLRPKVDSAQSVEQKNDILAGGIYSYFSEKYGTRQQPQTKSKHQKHQKALKKVTSLKNQARKDYRRARSAGFPPHENLALARNFYTLIRQHNSIKKKSQRDSDFLKAKHARQCCYKNFWTFAKNLLDDEEATKVTPQSTEESARQFFSSTYRSRNRFFDKPAWMHTPKPPTFEFDTGEISLDEIRAVIKHSKASSSPSPFDQIPYKVFKKCPSLGYALENLSNEC